MCIMPMKLITNGKTPVLNFIVCERENGRAGDREEMTFGSQFSLTMCFPVTELRLLDSAASAFTHATTSLPQDSNFDLLLVLLCSVG